MTPIQAQSLARRCWRAETLARAKNRLGKTAPGLECCRVSAVTCYRVQGLRLPHASWPIRVAGEIRRLARSPPNVKVR
ncbi:hypothetical protein DSL92_04065 [Billgrantia gudaonensis]|uniref:Uncharacterized protein n=1 Tax=Billgrantia gudaonensis TaxID=376427 RepID=A0A3S0NHI2_9GAMM|nr:hypothetical protein DSL92_04065 [Halomonas gudaonensis]